MNKHTCNLCFRRFSNGRALGGHMRSHATSAAVAVPKPHLQVYYGSPSSSSSASRAELEAAEQVAQVTDQEAAAVVADGVVVAGADAAKQLAYYGLRENPRKSFRLADPEFSSTFAAVDYVGVGSSVVLQDWESETESSKPPSLRRRSKRRRRASQLSPPKPEPAFEPEPVSSVSDTTPEEDVALCLMMLSRDVWTTNYRNRSTRDVPVEEEAEEEDGEQPPDDSNEKLAAVARSRRGGRNRYQCGTCRKVFRSYQALGGHRASHKKIRTCISPAVVDEEEEDDDHRHMETQIQDADSELNAVPSAGSAGRRIHECPVCFRVFGSGQALGGHKRSHLAYYSSVSNPGSVLEPNYTAPPPYASVTAAAASSSVHVNGATKFVGESFIDLNLPAPMEEEVELSAVSDEER